MPELDPETLERALRWCAEAGRQATLAEARAALAPLSWDELLAARALLAEPPPTRPLGPYALADLARGVPADQAAERERSERYPRAPAAGPTAVAPGPARLGPVTRKGRRGRAPGPTLVIRKASARAAPAPPAAPPLPLLDELLRPEGRAELERLVRLHGGRRPRLVGALAAGFRRADGQPLGDPELDRLLEHHDLARVYRRRERDEVLHAVRAAGGVLARAAAALGHDAASLAGAIDRLEARAEVEAVRAARRRDILGRATLAERARLLLTERERLEDLGLLGELEDELRRRLPDHVQALRSGRGPLRPALAQSLGLDLDGVQALALRLGIGLAAESARSRPERRSTERPRPARPDAPGRPGRAPRPGGPSRPPRPGAAGRPPRPSGSARPGRAPGGTSTRPSARGASPPGGRPRGRPPAGRRGR